MPFPCFVSHVNVACKIYLHSIPLVFLLALSRTWTFHALPSSNVLHHGYPLPFRAWYQHSCSAHVRSVICNAHPKLITPPPPPSAHRPDSLIANLLTYPCPCPSADSSASSNADSSRPLRREAAPGPADWPLSAIPAPNRDETRPGRRSQSHFEGSSQRCTPSRGCSIRRIPGS